MILSQKIPLRNLGYLNRKERHERSILENTTQSGTGVE